MNPRFLRSAAALAVSAGLSHAAPLPIIGDWWYIMPDGWRDADTARSTDPCASLPQYDYHSGHTFIPVNQPGGGHGGPSYSEGAWMSWYALCLAQQFEESGTPIAIMIRNRNCPFPYATGGGTTSPNMLSDALDVLPRLDYVLMDLENWGGNGTEMLQLNVAEIVRQVRSHPNPKISNAYIGNYSDWPGVYDSGYIWPAKRDRTAYSSRGSDPWDRNQFYHDHFNVAMPVAYPYQVHSRHSHTGLQRGNITPNDRAAIFWAPLERVSVPARELPAGHVLIPWMTNYSPFIGENQHYVAPPPTWADLEALFQHFRMRGALSYMLWTSDTGSTHHPTIDYTEFRMMSLDAWSMLDPLFNSADKVEFLNLDTHKLSGLQWSGVRAGDRVWVLVSNLHHEHEQAAVLPLISGLPSTTPAVPPGEHILFEYTVNPAVRDFNGDGIISIDDYIAFMASMRGGLPGESSNSVGGMGTVARDVNGDGSVDLQDVVMVSMAYHAGDFDMDNRGPSDDGDTRPPGKRPTAGAPLGRSSGR